MFKKDYGLRIFHFNYICLKKIELDWISFRSFTFNILQKWSILPSNSSDGVGLTFFILFFLNMLENILSGRVRLLQEVRVYPVHVETVDALETSLLLFLYNGRIGFCNIMQWIH